jgi:phosphoserine phosphatase
VSPDGQTLTGEVTGDIVNAERKAYYLKEIAKKEQIPLAHTVAVGDGANDLLMMREAGLSVAFNAKPVVQQQAKARINTESLLTLLDIFGFTKEEQDELLD